jgi:hypothetical protein
MSPIYNRIYNIIYNEIISYKLFESPGFRENLCGSLVENTRIFIITCELAYSAIIYVLQTMCRNFLSFALQFYLHFFIWSIINSPSAQSFYGNIKSSDLELKQLLI